MQYFFLDLSSKREKKKTFNYRNKMEVPNQNWLPFNYSFICSFCGRNSIVSKKKFLILQLFEYLTIACAFKIKTFPLIIQSFV